MLAHTGGRVAWIALPLVAVACASAPPRPAAPEPGPSLRRGLVAYWNLDEADGAVARDSSGMGNDGQYLGTSPSTEAAPVSFANPRSRVFGDHTAVSAPDSASLTLTGPMTVAVWVRSTNPDIVKQEAVVEKWDAVPLPQPTANGSTVTSKNGFMLRIDTQERPKFSVIADVGASTVAVSPIRVPVGVWCHLAGVYDGSNVSIYVDGALAATHAMAVKPLHGPSPLEIGISHGGHSFNGALDDVRIYDRALSAAEVKALAGR
jgi:hypothetical protein